MQMAQTKPLGAAPYGLENTGPTNPEMQDDNTPYPRNPALPLITPGMGPIMLGSAPLASRYFLNSTVAGMRPLRYSINVTLDGCCDHREMLADEDLHRYAAKPRAGSTLSSLAG